MIALWLWACVAPVPRPAPLPAPIEAPPLPPTTVQDLRLSNGVVARVVTRPGQETFDVAVDAPASAADEGATPCARYLAPVVRSLRTETAGEADLLRRAGLAGAGVWGDGSVAMGVVATAPVGHAAEALALWGEVVRLGQLDDDSTGRVRSLFVDGARTGHATPALVGVELALQASLQGTPDGVVCGAEQYEALDVQALRAFVDRVWTPRDARVVLVGPWTADEAAPLLEAALGGWRSEAPGGTPGPAPTLTLGERWVVSHLPAATQTQVILLRPLATRPAGELLAFVVAQRLEDRIREAEGWSYHAWCDLEEVTPGDGILRCRALVEGAHTLDAVAAMREELAATAAGDLSEDLVARARSLQRTIHAPTRSDSLLLRERTSLRLGRPPGGAQARQAAWDAVTRDELLAEAAGLDPLAWTVVLAGDLEPHRAALAGRPGFVEVDAHGVPKP